jgi:phosphoribosyl 1,2-cyclic phosphate phosphodiesterase
MKITILGCGSSGGVPLIGCSCAVCTSRNPKNNRTRVSLYIEINDIKLLVDTSPDLRQQALREGIKRVDAVLYTHDHADHTHGIDDLRSFNYLANASIPLYGDVHTMRALTQRYAYAFGPAPEKIWMKPSLTAHNLSSAAIHEFNVKNTRITAFEQLHGKFKTLGYRIGDFAYSTDTNELPATAFEALRGVKVWVVDCLRYTPSPVHANLEKSLEWIGRVKPEKAILTHMAHELDYEKLSKELPAGIEPAYDGMVIEL